MMNRWLVCCSAIIGTLCHAQTIVGNPTASQTINQPAGTNLYVNRLENVRFADQFANIQAAITDAGTNGMVVIPATYAGTDSYTNPNNILIMDLRGGASAYRGFFAVKDFGAKGDGTTDDGPALQAAIDAAGAAGGGIVYRNSGTYRSTQKLRFNRSNVSFVGPGTLLFQPNLPLGPNDRAILIHPQESNGSEGLGGPFNISGAVAAGTSTFTLTNHADASSFSPGQWIFIQEKDSGHGNEIYFIDWAQVQTASATTGVVTLYNPLRVSFPSTHSTVQATTITNLVENIEIKDLKVVTTDPSHALPGIFIGVAKNTRIIDCISNPKSGNAIASYRSKNLTITGLDEQNMNTQASEIAASVDVHLYANHFESVAGAPQTAALTLDYGTAFFNVIGNTFATGDNNLLAILYGVHDGAVSQNAFGTSVGQANGILARGTQNIIVDANTLVSNLPTGGSGYGISFGDDTIAVPSVASVGNVVALNRVGSFPSGSYAVNPPDVLLYTDVLGDVLSGNRVQITGNQFASTNASATEKGFFGADAFVSNDIGVGSSTNTPVKVFTNSILAATFDTSQQLVLPNTALLKRVRTTQATQLTTAKFALSATWGSTASVSTVKGTDQGWTITVTPNGSGISLNPTITVTFADGTWTTAPVTITKMTGGTGAQTQLSENPSATGNVITFLGTPVSGATYIISSIAMGW